MKLPFKVCQCDMEHPVGSFEGALSKLDLTVVIAEQVGVLSKSDFTVEVVT